MDRLDIKTGLQGSAQPAMDDVRKDPFLLDGLDLKSLERQPRVIVTNELFEPLTDDVSVRCIASPAFSGIRRFFSGIPPFLGLLNRVAALIGAVRLARAMRRRDAVGLISLGSLSGSFFCFLNSFKWLQGGPVLAYRVLLPAHAGRFKAYFISRALRQVTLIAVWSRAQVENYHRAFGIPRDHFVFLPYKANHSKTESSPMRVGDYIFSGGNSERDYKTLFEAVKELSIPVIVSTTKAETTRGLAVPENVMLIATEKQAFERVMAGSRLVALCVKQDIIRGAAEATMLNAMWHGKPVVMADNVSAADYIEDGVDGFIVPAGNVKQLRGRILELWNGPILAASMGQEARDKVARLYTHRQWKARMQALAMLVFSVVRPDMSQFTIRQSALR